MMIQRQPLRCTKNTTDMKNMESLRAALFNLKKASIFYKSSLFLKSLMTLKSLIVLMSLYNRGMRAMRISLWPDRSKLYASSMAYFKIKLIGILAIKSIQNQNIRY
jgi:hypothetical protein